MGRKGPFLWISQKNMLVRAARDTSKFITYNLPISRRRYMAEILPIRRNIQKQSINQSETEGLYSYKALTYGDTYHHVYI